MLRGVALRRVEFLKVVRAALGVDGDEALADAYAQTVVYGLLAARWLLSAASTRFTRVDVPELPAPLGALLASRCDPEVDALVDEIINLLAEVEVREVFAGSPGDPAIYFYERFLDRYDPRIRRRRGVYYTPDEVVEYLVRSAHVALQQRLGLRLGLADTTRWGDYAAARGMPVPDGVEPSQFVVQILDPATGTGTFLIRVVTLIHEVMSAEYARDLDAAQRGAAWQAYVRDGLLPRVHGLEVMAAPYVVCHLRLGLALAGTGFSFARGERLSVHLSDTLDPGGAGEAAWAKRGAPISVVVGNPPYERTSAADGRAPGPLAGAFDAETREAGFGGSLQTTHNLYYEFWRWVMWRILDAGPGLGVAAMITGSSYLRGPGFAGMRSYVRSKFDHAYILDLEGDRLGPRVSDNVFLIKIPVCAATFVRSGAGESAVFYRRVVGDRAAKLAVCAAASLADGEWRPVAGGRFAPFVAVDGGDYAQWPRLADVFPLRFTGYHFYRTWPVGETVDVLIVRWRGLMASKDRAELYKESRDRGVDGAYPPLFGGDKAPAIVDLPGDAPCPAPRRTCFRSFDRRWCLLDARLGDFLRPALWRTWSDRQVYMTSLLSGVLGAGPGATAGAYVPDCHHFRGSFGGKDVVPLWRDAGARVANVDESFIAALTGAHGRAPGPTDVFNYTYAVLAGPGYVRRFERGLQVPGPRLPVTRDRGLFDSGVALGRELLRWHTYGERFREPGDGFELAGGAAVIVEIPGTTEEYPERHCYDPIHRMLHVGAGRIGPVGGEVIKFSVSGLRVVEAWLDARMRRRAGKKTSPLDAVRPARWTEELTRELLELLWVLERTVRLWPALDEWLAEVLAGELLAEGWAQRTASLPDGVPVSVLPVRSSA